MKNFLFLLFCCQLSIAPAGFLKAQDATPAPEKDIVVVDFFSRNRIVPPSYAELLRGVVLQGFADRGRHRIVDAEASRELSANLPGQIYSDPATATTMQVAWLEARMEKMAATGARYVVTGTLADYKFEHVDLPPSSSKAKPCPGFNATFRVVLSAYDLKFRRAIPDETTPSPPRPRAPKTRTEWPSRRCTQKWSSISTTVSNSKPRFSNFVHPIKKAG